jgi:hypothetical protein
MDYPSNEVQTVAAWVESGLCTNHVKLHLRGFERQELFTPGSSGGTYCISLYLGERAKCMADWLLICICHYAE